MKKRLWAIAMLGFCSKLSAMSVTLDDFSERINLASQTIWTHDLEQVASCHLLCTEASNKNDPTIPSGTALSQAYHCSFEIQSIENPGKKEGEIQLFYANPEFSSQGEIVLSCFYLLDHQKNTLGTEALRILVENLHKTFDGPLKLTHTRKRYDDDYFDSSKNAMAAYNQKKPYENDNLSFYKNIFLSAGFREGIAHPYDQEELRLVYKEIEK